MISFKEVSLETPKREVLINVTDEVSKLIRESTIKEILVVILNFFRIFKSIILLLGDYNGIWV